MFILDVSTAPVPYVPLEGRVEVSVLAPRMWRAHARFGFMERPDLPAMLQRARSMGYAFDATDVIYYVAYEHIVPRSGAGALPRPVGAIFAFLQRNSALLTAYSRVPPDKVVAIGREFPI